MSTRVKIPPPVVWNGEAPSQQSLVARGRSLHELRRKSIDQVGTLARQQKTMGEDLSDELARLRAESETLRALDEADGQGGLLALLSRRLTRRSRMLERRSHTLALVQLYEEVGVDLRRAAQFSDELQLCALSLNSEVEALSAELERSRDNGERAAARVAALQRLLDEVGDSDAALADQLSFEQRRQRQLQLLCERAVALNGEALPEARELRDQVQGLQENMAEFVSVAASQIDASGRRIQALGAAADAPMVVAELRESLDHLDAAMELTSDTVLAASRLLDRTLPDLHAKLGAEAELDKLTAGLNESDAETKRDAELRRAAEEEVSSLSGKRL